MKTANVVCFVALVIGTAVLELNGHGAGLMLVLAFFWLCAG